MAFILLSRFIVPMFHCSRSDLLTLLLCPLISRSCLRGAERDAVKTVRSIEQWNGHHQRYILIAHVMCCNSIRQTRIFNTYEDASFIHLASTLHYHAEIPPSCYRLTRNTQIYSDIVVHLLQSHGKRKGGNRYREGYPLL